MRNPYIALTGVFIGIGSACAQPANACGALPNFMALKNALTMATSDETSGLNNHMWGTIVDRDGVVCEVAFSGVNRGAQWLGSRVISAQKANTGVLFSLDNSSNSSGSGQAGGLALSTANLYSAVQPGGSLFGLQASNPVNTAAAYGGAAARYGTATDPLVGQKIGGINVFGGGIPLYDAQHNLVGGLGVSGDTSCADHSIAWRARNILMLDHMAAAGALAAVKGISGDAARPDNIVFDIGANGQSAGGFGHPKCINTGDQTKLPAVRP